MQRVFMPDTTGPVEKQRVYCRREGAAAEGPVLWWMSRDARVADNPAMAFAREMALQRKVPLLAVFCLDRHFPDARPGHFRFLLDGLEETVRELESLAIPFFLLEGTPPESLPEFVNRMEAACVIGDFDPLRIKQKWQIQLAASLSCPFYEVDAHNIVPCRYVSEKLEVGARTLRPKLHRLLEKFHSPLPPPQRHPFPFSGETPQPQWDKWKAAYPREPAYPPAGTVAARKRLTAFLRQGLPGYGQGNRDPNGPHASRLSPYLHFGWISAREVARKVKDSAAPQEDKDAFLEQLIVRKELSDNFCFYNPDYDNPNSFPQWARDSLEQHKKDKREYLYTAEQLEQGKTQDPLWNACQGDLTRKGTMPNYLRMYWAKKILEWTPSAAEALAIGLDLNNRYQLDGRDPNGYTGLAWSVGGVHDRPWKERDVFGKIRYMNAAGCARKFDVQAYIQRVTGS